MVHYYVYKNIIFTEPVFDTLTKYLAQRPISSTGPMGNMAIPSFISPYSQKGETPEFTDPGVTKRISPHATNIAINY